MIISFALILAATAEFLIIPYKQITKMQKMFLGEQLYEELFQMKVEFSPENEKVQERFNFLLRKQDAINLSKKQAEYLALQNQINPHFLYNTLEAIRGDAICAGVHSIAETTEALATFFRYTISETENLVSVEDELENVDNYFKIQQYRFGEKMKMEITTEDDESIQKWLIPKLTLQPIIENAIYHGLECKAQGGLVTIHLQTTEKRLLISIKDNGIGMNTDDVNRINSKLEKVKVSYLSDEKKQRGGIALRNVAQRIKLLFGEEYGIQLYSALSVGTEVRINLPKIMKTKDGIF